MNGDEATLGKLVQLNSGGTPGTIVEHVHRMSVAFGKTRPTVVKVAFVSAGGMVQELVAPVEALRHYNGELTPSRRG